jgi:hypothetical protein
LMQKMADLHKVSAMDPSGMARSLAAQVLEYGQSAMDVGLTEEGFGAIQKGVNLLQNAANIDQMHADEMKYLSNLTSNLMEHVTDQKSWQQALMVFQTTTGKPSPYSKTPYSPELVQHLKDVAQTRLQQAESIKDRAQAAAAEAEIPLHRAQAKKDAIDAERDQIKLDAERKAGVAREPAPKDTAAIYNQIKGKYDEDPAVIKKVIADEGLDQEVEKLVAQGASRNEAATKVFSKAESEGKFGAQGWKPRHKAGPQPGAAAKPGGTKVLRFDAQGNEIS